ncbi:MAG: UbiD family decarboxylase [Chloroflexi bacterium]|nr:UbiD family decarboxylase [Chloroflexota bacterium]
MAFQDLREWMAKLEAENELKRVQTKVDWNLELAEVGRRVLAQRGPALLFENIKDHETTRGRKLFTSALAKKNRIAMMLGLDKDAPREEMVRTVRERFKQTVKPVRVESGPVKENIVMGADVNLFEFPVPKWHPLDGGRYINTFAGIVTRDPETRQLNMGIYRGMIAGKDKICVYMIPQQHWGLHYLKYQERGEAMPVAVVYGWDPAMPFVAGTPIPAVEYEVMGAVRREPVPLVRCQTSDLEVPASAEIVVEGTISPDPAAFEDEGPFGEWPGYYGWSRKRPVIKVGCITHRNDPVFRGQLEGMKPGVISEAGYMAFYSHAALLWNYLESAGVPGVLDIVPVPTIIVKIRKTYEGQAKQVAAALWGSWISLQFAKTIVVVDEDVDIHNLRALELAFRDRVDPKDDLVVYPWTAGSPLDPSIAWDDRDEWRYGTGLQNRLLIDATIDWRKHPVRPEWGNRRYPPPCAETDEATTRLVDRRWKEYGV